MELLPASIILLQLTLWLVPALYAAYHGCRREIVVWACISASAGSIAYAVPSEIVRACMFATALGIDLWLLRAALKRHTSCQ